MGIFFTDGHERLVQQVSDGGALFSSIECHLYVYKASRVGPSGFDRFPEGRTMVERMLRGSMILSSGMDSMPLLHPTDSHAFEVVRRESSRGCLSFGPPDSELRGDVDALQHLHHELKKQKLRKRFGHTLPPDPPASLRSLFHGERIDSMLLQFVLRHSPYACLWMWGEFGLHFLSLSQNAGGASDFVKAAALEQGIELIAVDSSCDIPSW
ncbi:hypothetical protein [Melittangium boletus]|nr:hypothetical protein [Melittangium boletus]